MVARSGEPFPPPSALGRHVIICEAPDSALSSASSTLVRKLLARGESVSHLLPAAEAAYLSQYFAGVH